MTKTSNKSESLTKKNLDSEAEFNKIKEGLKAFPNKVIESIKQKVGAGDWKLSEINAMLDDGKSSIDAVFSASDGKKEKYVIADISVPHLGVGQKYALPGKAKLFQQERKVAAIRIKRAIILIRKGTESISTTPLKLRCPIIELSYESLVKEQPKERQKEQPEKGRIDNRPGNRRDQPQSGKTEAQATATTTATTTSATTGVSQELLFALKEAIVHECLSTMHKRCNKYIRKGLWRWIEREIMDPNVHFYLIILSSIYQGKTGEILSRRFKTPEAYSDNPDNIIEAIFSRENSLADEIKKSGERHKKALKKFLACFSQTPPFEYLKSIFLKEFRTHADGLKARMTVYSTLHQLLERCGFEGEKETRYPLEILDELKIFQGIMTGNYAALRTDNASKKLRHLVPQIEWTDEDIYQLRNHLAKALNLPAQEFNLNAFLPQAFFHDARHLAETRKEAFRAPVHPNQKQAAKEPAEQRQPKPSQPHRQRDNSPTSAGDDFVANNSPRSRQPITTNEPIARAETHNRPSPHPKVDTQQPVSRRDNPEESAISARTLVESQSSERDDYSDSHDKRRPNDCDESRHRYFENFGGHTEEDTDSVKLALAMDKYNVEKVARSSETKAATAEEPDEMDLIGQIPSKPRPGRSHVNMNPNPPRKAPNGSTGADNTPPSRPDRKRRFTRNPGQRSKMRRPSGGGINR